MLSEADDVCLHHLRDTRVPLSLGPAKGVVVLIDRPPPAHRCADAPARPKFVGGFPVPRQRLT
jgi:hypothetical protein